MLYFQDFSSSYVRIVLENLGQFASFENLISIPNTLVIDSHIQGCFQVCLGNDADFLFYKIKMVLSLKGCYVFCLYSKAENLSD